MTPERFRAMLDAYGADFRRWPESERDSARRLAEASPEVRQQLKEAARLDGWLDSYAVAAADDALVKRVLADAADRSARLIDRAEDSAAPRNPWWKARWWVPGAGLAAAGLAGSIAGAFVVTAALRVAAPPPAVDWPERATAFSELPADWRDE